MGFMNELDQEYAPGWRPEPGDTIQGIVESMSSRDGGYGVYPVLTVRRILGEDGAERLTEERVAIHCMSTVLQGWVEENGITVGDRVGLRYNGKKVSEKSGRTFDDFSKARQPAALVPENLRLSAAPAPAASSAADTYDPF